MDVTACMWGECSREIEFGIIFFFEALILSYEPAEMLRGVVTISLRQIHNNKLTVTGTGDYYA